MNSSLNHKNALLIGVALTIGLWLLIIYIKDIPAHLSTDALKEIPAVAGYISTFCYIFAKWLWKLPLLQGWLVTTPNLNGTWNGPLTTTWIDPTTGFSPAPKDVFLVIRQTLTQIHFTLITAESKSESRASGILYFAESNKTLIEFTYQNNPKVTLQQKSKIHDGAASLEYTTVPEMRLTGKYWSDRESKGELELKFHSKLHREVYA